jgi:hypothetical protein
LPSDNDILAHCPFVSHDLIEAWRLGFDAGVSNDGRRNAYDVGAGISIGDWPRLVAWEIGRNAVIGQVEGGEEDLSGYQILLRRMRDAKLLRRGKFCNVDLAGVPLSRPWPDEVSCWLEVLDSISAEKR